MRGRGLVSAALAASLLFGPLAAPAAASGKLSLQDALNAAATGNPAVVEQQKRYEEKDSRITIAQSWANPKFGIMKDDIPKGTLAPGQGMMTEYTLSQEVMFPGKLGLMGRMAASDAAMAKEAHREKKLQVYVDVKQAYYDLLYATQALAVGREAQLLMGQLAELARVNYATGMVPLQDTLRAQTEFSKMSTDLITMTAMETVAKGRLNTLMGRQADAALEIAEEFGAPPPEFDLAALQADAAAKPAVLGMKAQVEMAAGGLDLAKMQTLPDFELRLGWKEPKDEMIAKTWRVEMMAMVPLWGGKNKAQIAAADANLGAARAALAGMNNMAGLDVQMALVEAQAAWRQIDLYKSTIVPQAEQTYQAAVIAYTNGKADFMAVLDSLATLRNAKLGHYKARTDYEKAAANLEKAVGKPLFASIGQF